MRTRENRGQRQTAEAARARSGGGDSARVAPPRRRGGRTFGFELEAIHWKTWKTVRTNSSTTTNASTVTAIYNFF
jgi:hypothetical protein